ncbi:hypothetical protein ACN2WE_02900 [Streptomyces sp. cg28]|uniref:hypothetical protein n=1 Tax=unclassified Streptomyces TaxID=2593676 RepID=UPI000DBA6BF9|nr:MULTISPECIES: hypothetical protein [unclassified Streptomyces]MYT75204.1 hypothetical protein [Streptomyces sp. SID8367]RAJ77160.1 hypothetical protein K377_05918 [Streptomyces sp. PsTaAH-137]
MLVAIALIVIGLLVIAALLLILRRRGGEGVRGHAESTAQLRGQSDGWSDGNSFRQKSGPQ